jgi:hypothetical protein
LRNTIHSANIFLSFAKDPSQPMPNGITVSLPEKAGGPKIQSPAFISSNPFPHQVGLEPTRKVELNLGPELQRPPHPVDAIHVFRDSGKLAWLYTSGMADN